MDDSKTQWCYAAAGEWRGPVTATELARLLADGDLHAATPVWRRGMPRWQLLAEVEALAAGLSGPPRPDVPVAGNTWMLWAAAAGAVLALLGALSWP